MKHITVGRVLMWVALSVGTAGVVMACTCYDLTNEECVPNGTCDDACSPACGDTIGKWAHMVDKCQTKTTGYDTCEAHPTDKVDCYEKTTCEVGTQTCPSDAAEKQCDVVSDSEKDVKTSKKILSGSGCGP